MKTARATHEQTCAILPYEIEECAQVLEKLMLQQERRAQHAYVQYRAAPEGARKKYWSDVYVKHVAQRRSLEAAILAVREACK